MKKSTLLASLCLFLTFLLTGCTSMDKTTAPEEPSANQIFHTLYTTVTLAASANGNQEKFRWKTNTEPLPYQQASWADVTVFPCDNGNGQLKLEATTTHDRSIDNPNYLDQIEKVRTTWENHGLTVRNVGSSKGMMQIATDLEHGTVVVYTAGVAGEAIEADTECFSGFKGDTSTAETYPGETGVTQSQ